MSKEQHLPQRYDVNLQCFISDRRTFAIILLIKLYQIQIGIVEHFNEELQPLVLKTQTLTLTQEYSIIDYLMKNIKNIERHNCIKKIEDKRNQEEESKDQEVQTVDQQHNNMLKQQYQGDKTKLYLYLEDLYKYLFGFQLTTEFKYYEIKNNIQRQINILQSKIQSNPTLYSLTHNYYLSLTIAKLFYAYKLVFNKLFWDSYPLLHTKILQMASLSPFIDTFGHLTQCVMELRPIQFINNTDSQR